MLDCSPNVGVYLCVTSKHTVNQCVPAPVGSAFEMAVRRIWSPAFAFVAKRCIALAISCCTKFLFAMIGKSVMRWRVVVEARSRGQKIFLNRSGEERTCVGCTESPPCVSSKCVYWKISCTLATVYSPSSRTRADTLSTPR